MKRGRVRFHSWRITALHSCGASSAYEKYASGCSSHAPCTASKGENRTAGGYTIVETLIFLAVSGAMFVSVAFLVNGQQQRTEFTQAVRNFESNLQDIANDVSTGYAAYPFNSDESCKVTGTGAVVIDPSPVGAQQRCIFVGRAIQGAPSGTDKQTYQVYTVVGRQRNSSGKEVGNLTEATPVVLAPGNGPRAGIRDLSQQEHISASASIAKITYNQGGADISTGAFGFFTTFQGYGASGINSGDLKVDVAPIAGSGTVQAPLSSAALADRFAAPANITPLNPTGGITICLTSNGSRQYALVRLGGSGNGRLTVTSSIETGTPPVGKCS